MKRPKTHQIPGGPKIRVYDNGGETTDRYTVVLVNGVSRPGFKEMLGLDGCGGKVFSQFTEGQEGEHLGNGVNFEDLDQKTKDHIYRRILCS